MISCQFIFGRSRLHLPRSFFSPKNTKNLNEMEINKNKNNKNMIHSCILFEYYSTTHLAAPGKHDREHATWSIENRMHALLCAWWHNLTSLTCSTICFDNIIRSDFSIVFVVRRHITQTWKRRQSTTVACAILNKWNTLKVPRISLNQMYSNRRNVIRKCECS